MHVAVDIVDQNLARVVVDGLQLLRHFHLLRVGLMGPEARAGMGFAHIDQQELDIGIFGLQFTDAGNVFDIHRARDRACDLQFEK